MCRCPFGAEERSIPETGVHHKSRQSFATDLRHRTNTCSGKRRHRKSLDPAPRKLKTQRALRTQRTQRKADILNSASSAPSAFQIRLSLAFECSPPDAARKWSKCGREATGFWAAHFSDAHTPETGMQIASRTRSLGSLTHAESHLASIDPLREHPACKGNASPLGTVRGFPGGTQGCGVHGVTRKLPLRLRRTASRCSAPRAGRRFSGFTRRRCIPIHAAHASCSSAGPRPTCTMSRRGRSPRGRQKHRQHRVLNCLPGVLFRLPPRQ